MLQGPSLFTRISYTTLTISHSFIRVSLIFCISKHKFTTRRHDSKVRKTTSEFFRVFLPPNYRPNFNMDVNYDSQILFRSEYQARKCRKNILIRQAKYRSWHRQFSSGRKKKGGGGIFSAALFIAGNPPYLPQNQRMGHPLKHLHCVPHVRLAEQLFELRCCQHCPLPWLHFHL